MKRPTKARKRATRTHNKRFVVFDVETEQFAEQFRQAKDAKARLIYAPKMRLACAFDGIEWMYFVPSDSKKLVALLTEADEVITFNGNAFDMLVLMKHHGLKAAVVRKIKHCDLFELISKKEDRWISLNDLAQLNLQEGKHTKGRSIAALDLAGLKEACRSDVWQTFRLWEMWCDGTLRLPEQRVRLRRKIVNTLIFIEHDPEEMSEGQLADYNAGMFGTSYCRTCETEIDWGF